MDSIFLLLQRKPEFGSQIQQLVVRDFKGSPNKEESPSFIKLWVALDFAAERQLTQAEAGYQLLESMLRKCQTLQTLVLAGGIYSFRLVAISQGRSLPLPFLTQSLKRLFVGSGGDPK